MYRDSSSSISNSSALHLWMKVWRRSSYRIKKEELTLICGLSEPEKSSDGIVVALKPGRIILCYQPEHKYLNEVYYFYNKYSKKVDDSLSMNL